MLFRKKKKVHLLHIGKTGGTTLNALVKDIVFNDYDLILHNHDYQLKMVPEGEFVIFFLRNPIDRFVSGFYSRKRQGRPQYDVPWNDKEAIGFAAFDTPRALAEALSSTNRTTYRSAIEAMSGIRHVNTYFSDWLTSIDYLVNRMDCIFFIGFQESFSDDITGLGNKLDVKFDVSLKQHASPEDDDKHLSELAVQNLNTWYQEDLRIYLFAQKLRAKLGI